MSLKSRFNKIKVGNKVQISARAVEWWTSHLTWLYGVIVKNDASYNENEKEIRIADLPSIHVWIGARLTGKMPIGIVSHYGEADSSPKTGSFLKKKVVYVRFSFKTKFGNVTDGMYVSERDLEVIKKIKKSKKESKSRK